MSNILSARLKRLEQRHGPESRYAHLSDEELEARIEDLTRAIETEAGMAIDVIAEMLRTDLVLGRTPKLCTEHDARLFLEHLSTLPTKGEVHVR